VDQLITFDPNTFIFQNINKVEIDGFEIYGEFEPVVHLKLRVDYTALSARDASTDEQLLRRAKDRLQLAINYALSSIPASVGISYRYVGARFDNNFESYPPARERLSPYGLVDLRMTYQAAESLRLYGRVENLLDEQYQDVLGFGTYGRGLFAGLEVTL
jgi:vitamin B12 transporter